MADAASIPSTRIDSGRNLKQAKKNKRQESSTNENFAEKQKELRLFNCVCSSIATDAIDVYIYSKDIAVKSIIFKVNIEMNSVLHTHTHKHTVYLAIVCLTLWPHSHCVLVANQCIACFMLTHKTIDHYLTKHLLIACWLSSMMNERWRWRAGMRTKRNNKKTKLQ